MEFGEPVECDNDNAAVDMGSASLNLLNRAAEAIAFTEARLQSELQTVLDQLNRAEERNRSLTHRVNAADARAEEAEQWLRRIHAKLAAEWTHGAIQ